MKALKYLVIAFMLVMALHIAQMNLYLFLEPGQDYNVWYWTTDAIMFTCYISLLYICVHTLHRILKTTVTALLDFIVIEWLFISFYNLTDELFKTFTGFHLLEYVCGILCVITACYKLRTWRRDQLLKPEKCL